VLQAVAAAPSAGQPGGEHHPLSFRVDAGAAGRATAAWKAVRTDLAGDPVMGRSRSAASREWVIEPGQDLGCRSASARG